MGSFFLRARARYSDKRSFTSATLANRMPCLLPLARSIARLCALRNDRQLVQVLDERHHRAVPAHRLRVRGLDDVVLVGGVGAAAVAEAEVARGQAERRVGEDVPGIAARVA